MVPHLWGLTEQYQLSGHLATRRVGGGAGGGGDAVHRSLYRVSLGTFQKQGPRERLSKFYVQFKGNIHQKEMKTGVGEMGHCNQPLTLTFNLKHSFQSWVHGCLWARAVCLLCPLIKPIQGLLRPVPSGGIDPNFLVSLGSFVVSLENFSFGPTDFHQWLMKISYKGLIVVFLRNRHCKVISVLDTWNRVLVFIWICCLYSLLRII